VPPLRERTDDIPLLVSYCIDKFGPRNNSKAKGVTAEAMALLMAHPWPGNVRELENVLERAIILSREEMIEKNMLFDSALTEAKENIEGLYSDRPTLDKLEERYIKLIMTEVNSKKDEAATILGVSRRTLYRKERTYGMIPDDAVEPSEVIDESSS
jgi:two-component system response regulator HydG